ncbi:MAG: methyltransferase domain-containing protein [Verrucomicrobiota bacterium]
MTEFNQYAEEYDENMNRSLGGLKHDVFIASKVWHLRQLFDQWDLSPASKVLDLGCGVGKFDTWLEDRCELHGCDPSNDSIGIARKTNPRIPYQTMCDGKIPYPDSSFDLIFTINVMHHVPPAEWNTFLHEAKSKLKPGALLCIFEHNPWNPLTQLSVKNCAFDEDAVLLPKTKIRSLLQAAGFAVRDGRYIVFFPFHSTRFFALETCLRWVPFGAQYYQCGSKEIQ